MHDGTTTNILTAKALNTRITVSIPTKIPQIPPPKTITTGF